MDQNLISSQTLRVFQEYLVSYSVLREIKDMFEDASIFAKEDYDPGESSVRRNLIKKYYASLDLKKWSDIRNLLKVFESILVELHVEVESASTNTELQEFCERMIRYLQRDGFSVEENRIVYAQDPALWISHDNTTAHDLPVVSDLFKHQFPAGLPFGLNKPNFAIVAGKRCSKTQI